MKRRIIALGSCLEDGSWEDGSWGWDDPKVADTDAEILACQLMDAMDGCLDGDFLRKHPIGWVTAAGKKNAEYWIDREFLKALEASETK